MTTSYFEKIEELITASISEAEVIVCVAVAWFTNLRLLNVLCNALQRGLGVKVLIIDDTLNRCEFGLDFGALTMFGADVRFAKSRGGIMHNKYCIIDNAVITGSYNWTYHANNNNENIIVTDEVNIVNSYCEQFEMLFREATPVPQPYEHQKWADVKEGDFSELRRSIYRDVVAQSGENTELKRIKLINLDHAYKSGNAEELSKASSLSIEKKLRTIKDVLISRSQDFTFKLWKENLGGKPFDDVDGYVKSGKWWYIPYAIKEDQYHREYIEGVLYTSKEKRASKGGLKLNIYDEEYIADIKKVLCSRTLSMTNRKFIPDYMLRIDLAKMFFYQFPSPRFNNNQMRTWQNNMPRVISAINLFGIVKDTDGDKVEFYDGWNPQKRGEKIMKEFFVKGL